MPKLQQKVVIGIDMGATHIRICVMGQYGEILATERRKTLDIIQQDFTQGLIQFCQDFIQEYQILKIVIGLPAAISADRHHVLSVPNLNLSQQALDNLLPALTTHFKCEVVLERDVNLQMIYDVHHYKIQNKLALGVYLGTGMGFSIWNQGKLFIGAHGVAGELGHIPYGDENLRCNCGNYGCLETSCSGIALKKWYENNKLDYPIDLIFENATNTLFIQHYLKCAAKAIATTVNLFDAEYLILGGGVIDMQAFPMEQLKGLLEQYIRKPLPYNELNILKAESSSFNGAIGAALYANQS